MAKTDDKVMQLLRIAKEKKDRIATVEKVSWKTNCSFSFNENDALNSKINLHAVSDVNVLVKALAHILQQQDYYTQAANKLGVDTQFKYLGFYVSDWQADIENRINRIKILKEKEELQTIETRLNALISPEKRAELELEQLENALNNK
jgi:hypothetical protein